MIGIFSFLLKKKCLVYFRHLLSSHSAKGASDSARLDIEDIYVVDGNHFCVLSWIVKKYCLYILKDKSRHFLRHFKFLFNMNQGIELLVSIHVSRVTSTTKPKLYVLSVKPQYWLKKIYG